MYERTGRIRIEAGELFSDLSWFYVLNGMGVTPQSYDPLMDVVGDAQLRDILARLAQSTHAVVAAAPSHDSYFPAGANESTPS
jgi:tryptophan halogenase